MRVKLQLVLCSDDGRQQTVTDIVSLNKDCHRIEQLGLTLAESKQLLKLIQKKLLQQQVEQYLDAHSQRPDCCGATLKAKSYTNRSFRTLFGPFKLPGPRLLHCTRKRRKTTSFRPLSALLTESVANVYKALYKIDDIESLIYNFEQTYPKFTQLVKAVEEFGTYIRNNAHLIPNYGERYRQGEVITTSFVESTVNQVVSKRFCKKQQMQWSKRGAHLLLQARVKTLNREWALVFKRWYPDIEIEEWGEAA